MRLTFTRNPSRSRNADDVEPGPACSTPTASRRPVPGPHTVASIAAVRSPGMPGAPTPPTSSAPAPPPPCGPPGSPFSPQRLLQDLLVQRLFGHQLLQPPLLYLHLLELFGV